VKNHIIILGSKSGFIVSSEEFPEIIFTGENLSELVKKVEEKIQRKKERREKPLKNSSL